MLSERDPEVEFHVVRQARETRSRQDTLILMNSWRAIARSEPKDGELHFTKDRPQQHS
jgi:hypothetical protein